MSKQQEHVDAYAETHILEMKPAMLHVVSRDSDNLALYDEYARELAAATAAGPAPPKRASKRAPAARKRKASAR